MKIIWLPRAVKDLELITEYISIDSASMASLVVSKIVTSVDKLKHSPGIGRPGLVKTTRELVLVDVPYTIPYRVRNKTLEILRVYHQSRKWPKHF